MCVRTKKTTMPTGASLKNTDNIMTGLDMVIQNSDLHKGQRR